MTPMSMPPSRPLFLGTLLRKVLQRQKSWRSRNRSITSLSSVMATVRFGVLAAFAFKAAPVAKQVLDGIDAIKAMNTAGARTLPKAAPVDFIKPRWEQHVLTDDGINKNFYELCALSELKNALRSGDVWVPGSRQFKDFDDYDYLLPQTRFIALHAANNLSLAIDTDCERYLQDRLSLLKQKLTEVERLAASGELPDAEIADELLKIKPLSKSVPEEAERLEETFFGVIPRPKIRTIT